MSPQRRFPNEAASVSAARRYTLEVIGALEAQLADGVAVMISELAANAVRHSGTYFTVTIDRTDDLIRVAVTDSGAGSPIVRTPEPIEPSGRGLQIVQALAVNWGVIPNSEPPGKTVWFTIEFSPEVEEPARGDRAELEPTERRDSLAQGGGGALPSRQRRGASTNRTRPASSSARRRDQPTVQVTQRVDAGWAARRSSGMARPQLSHMP